MSTHPATTGKILLTAEEFAALANPDDGSQQELVGGEVVTMPPPSFLHGVVQGNIAYVLKVYANLTKSGRVTVESGMLTENGPDTLRGPDVAFWSFARLPADHVPMVYATVAPDLVAEVVSPSNTRKQVAKKVREYFASGVRLVWVVDPDERTVTVYHKPGDGAVLWEDATLTGGGRSPRFFMPGTRSIRLTRDAERHVISPWILPPRHADPVRRRYGPRRVNPTPRGRRAARRRRPG